MMPDDCLIKGHICKLKQTDRTTPLHTSQTIKKIANGKNEFLLDKKQSARMENESESRFKR